MNLPSTIVRGAAAGVAATTAMSMAMLAAKRAGLLRELPPKELTARATARAGLGDDVDAGTRRQLGWLLHYAFGATLGAMFAAGRELTHGPGPDVAYATPFALMVWLVSYAGWVPALRLLPPPTKDDPDRPMAMVGAHLVFAATLAAAWRTR
jgi:hypothetical protein